MSFFKDILPVAGGILGSAFGPMGAAVGSGIASLIAGNSPKDALMSGILSGVGAKAFPGMGEAVSGYTGMGSEAVKQAAAQKAAEATAQKAVAETVAKEAAKKTASQGILGLSTGDLLATSMLAGALSEPEQPSNEPYDPKSMESRPDYEGTPVGQLFINPYTGETYDTVEEYREAMAQGPQEYAQGGYIRGPGNGTSDDIPAKIYQNGQPVQEARLSDGEFVMTKRAVDGAGGAARMYEMMKKYEAMA